MYSRSFDDKHDNMSAWADLGNKVKLAKGPDGQNSLASSQTGLYM
jgi:hypothetical protein